MKTVLKIEELAMALACLYLLYSFQPAWWWYLLFLLGPDISFMGYALGNKAGAVSYNLLHHKGIATALLLAGFLLNQQAVLMAGLIVFGHSSMDRFFGYGLKHVEGFKFTHLGQIGNK